MVSFTQKLFTRKCLLNQGGSVKVFICYQCYYNFCDCFKTITKVFLNEIDAMNWVTELDPNETEWREYCDMYAE